jgi:hypothetical protein
VVLPWEYQRHVAGIDRQLVGERHGDGLARRHDQRRRRVLRARAGGQSPEEVAAAIRGGEPVGLRGEGEHRAADALDFRDGASSARGQQYGSQQEEPASAT